LGVLGHAEVFEPVRNLLHRGPLSRIYRGPTGPLDQGDREFMRQIPSVVETAGLNTPSRCPPWGDPPRGPGLLLRCTLHFRDVIRYMRSRRQRKAMSAILPKANIRFRRNICR
jgi:hypothetical protein